MEESPDAIGTGKSHGGEAERLERLWAGEFGNAYVDRNTDAYGSRGAFWLSLMKELRPRSVLEIGCNIGGNLEWIARCVAPTDIAGLDVNAKALCLLEERVPGVRTIRGSARRLPLATRSTDFVFTMGLLIHQTEEVLPAVMSEIVRVSRRYVFCGEFFAAETVEVPYRGERGALFRRDYGSIYESLFPAELRMVRRGYLSREEGWDNVTWWLFERR